MFFGEQASHKEKNETRMNAALAFLGQRALGAAEGLHVKIYYSFNTLIQYRFVVWASHTNTYTQSKIDEWHV